MLSIKYVSISTSKHDNHVKQIVILNFVLKMIKVQKRSNLETKTNKLLQSRELSSTFII